MIKLNNKGFAISTLLYSMIIMVMMIVMIMMSIMATTRKSTKELSETIEQELTGHAKTEAEFNASGTYEIPKAGWYKIEIWNDATDKYSSSVNYYSTAGTDLSFSFSSGYVTTFFSFSAERDINNPGLSYSKARIRLVSEAVTAPPKTATGELQNGKYYISKSGGSYEVLTLDPTDDSVNFAPLNGEKNQEWIVETVCLPLGDISYYKIINSATGKLLIPQEENASENTTVEATLDNNGVEKDWLKWTISDSGSGNYTIQTKLYIAPATSGNYITHDATFKTTSDTFNFIYSQY